MLQREYFVRKGSGIDMRIIGVFILLLSLVLLSEAEDKDPHAPIREKCKREFELTDEELKEAINDPKDMGCYLLCFFGDLSIMDDKGDFDPYAAMDAIEKSAKDSARPFIFSCYEQVKKSSTRRSCDRALEVVNCFKEQAPDLYKNLGLFHPLGEE